MHVSPWLLFAALAYGTCALSAFGDALETGAFSSRSLRRAAAARTWAASLASRLAATARDGSVVRGRVTAALHPEQHNLVRVTLERTEALGRPWPRFRLARPELAWYRLPADFSRSLSRADAWGGSTRLSGEHPRLARVMDTLMEDARLVEHAEGTLHAWLSCPTDDAITRVFDAFTGLEQLPSTPARHAYR